MVKTTYPFRYLICPFENHCIAISPGDGFIYASNEMRVGEFFWRRDWAQSQIVCKGNYYASLPIDIATDQHGGYLGTAFIDERRKDAMVGNNTYFFYKDWNMLEKWGKQGIRYIATSFPAKVRYKPKDVPIGNAIYISTHMRMYSTTLRGKNELEFDNSSENIEPAGSRVVDFDRFQKIQ